MIYTNYEVFDLYTHLSEYAKKINKPVAYVRAYGWNNSSDVEKINNSMEVYKDLLPLDLYTILHDNEYVVVELDDIDLSLEFFQEHFPESQATCEKELYIHWSLFNHLGQLVESNE